MAALEKTIRYAHEKGMYVIADIKRGDIGSTAEAYADAWLGVTKVGEALCGGFNADCVTLNGYMGADSVNPFLKVAGERDKSVFILAKTSNPGSGELQNVAVGRETPSTALWPTSLRSGEPALKGSTAISGPARWPGLLIRRSYRSSAPGCPTPSCWFPATGPRAAPPRMYSMPSRRMAGVPSSTPPGASSVPGRRRAKNGADYQEAARAAAIAMRDDICRFIRHPSKPRKQRGTHP